MHVTEHAAKRIIRPVNVPKNLNLNEGRLASSVLNCCNLYQRNFISAVPAKGHRSWHHGNNSSNTRVQDQREFRDSDDQNID